MPKSIHILNKTSPRWRPFPWSRFSADDCPRAKPLPVCPVAKCRRAKVCLAAHKGLFCQRTHFGRAEHAKRTPLPEIDQYIASLPKPPLSAGHALHADYLLEIAALRSADQREKMKLWRAGAYGDRYGPYSTKGCMKTPPPRIYVED